MLLLWDIDGTLLTTARAGIAAWEQALYEVSGVRADLGSGGEQHSGHAYPAVLN